MTGTEDLSKALLNLKIIEENLAVLTDGGLGGGLENLSEVLPIDDEETDFGGKASAAIKNTFLNTYAGDVTYVSEPKTETAGFDVGISAIAGDTPYEATYEPAFGEYFEAVFSMAKNEAVSFNNILNETDNVEHDISALGQSLSQGFFDMEKTKILGGDCMINGSSAESLELTDMEQSSVQMISPIGPANASAIIEFVAGESGGSGKTEIKVDARSTNTVNSTLDLDDMTEYIAEKLREAMYTAAEGVH